MLCHKSLFSLGVLHLPTKTWCTPPSHKDYLHLIETRCKFEYKSAHLQLLNTSSLIYIVEYLFCVCTFNVFYPWHYTQFHEVVTCLVSGNYIKAIFLKGSVNLINIPIMLIGEWPCGQRLTSKSYNLTNKFIMTSSQNSYFDQYLLIKNYNEKASILHHHKFSIIMTILNNNIIVS